MKFAFVTCVQLGLSCMEKIYRIGGKLDLLITLKDEKAQRKSGRIYLDDFATGHQIPLLKINHINDFEVLEKLRAHDIDWLFIIGWSQIAGKKIIETPRNGAVGIHPTLLPIGRGRAAIPWTILKGLDKTGVTMFKMDEGVDTGDILGQVEIPIEKRETATTLYKKVNTAHEKLIEKVWPQLQDGSVVPIGQDNLKATYWEGRKPEDGLIDPPKMTVEEVDRLVRAVTRPYPGAFIYLHDKKFIIWEGKPPGEEIHSQDILKIKLVDGYYIATNFESVMDISTSSK